MSTINRSLGKTFEQVALGDTASVTRQITAQDIDAYAEFTGDYNATHMDEAFARQMKFPGRVAHGPITQGLIAPVIGTKLPGQGCLLVSLATDFLKPVIAGDTITASATLVAKNAERRSIELELRFVNQRNEDVATGKAVVKPRKPDA